ncbi:carbonic anhydrase family protein [Danxiaibacter flavus]|uniref:Carbonic anhydrase family protein n=1 Tax=Danxiaibacter flavus TaxID=3049108 RepID=A0ABV3ZBF3_9BACT|nr:carbonic anhydrase family protein [Chitinophagaceae bacterium DXS]
MNYKSLLLQITMIVTLLACQNKHEAHEVNDADEVKVNKVMILADSVLTADQQAKLTPDEIIALLKKGNDEFVSDSLTVRNNSAKVRRAALGQYPKAVILSCLDSRVPVEDVFHRGIGDVFVARIAGNFVNEDILGSMEFGCKVAGAKVILVLGHEYCGAIKSAIDDVKLGNITAMLSKIRPAVTSLTSFTGDKTSKNNDFVHAVCEQNVKLTMQQITAKSPMLKELVDKNQLKVVGAIYNMNTGKVDFL